ncbi:SDR family NAD(P)-dependent oxidoreductase [Pontibacter sp. 13R65]|uniref:SDR family NAD(P)-dependent oxidoreductase n=1 Tax=Pontibacter sp. 13R65 TaxID=3127458 RepID=UPI00301E1EB8
MNETALITGASSGIGFELARCFARDGYRLVLVAHYPDGLEAAAGKLQSEFPGCITTLIPCDLSKPEGPEQLYAETNRLGLQIDVLVNDAGFGEYGPFVESDLQKELAMIQLNVASLVHLTKLYLRDMVPRKHGKILQLGSVVSFMPNPLQSIYAATKAFILSFSESIQKELKDTGITVTILCPPETDTNFFEVANMENTAIAQGNLATPQEVAEAGYKGLMSGEARVLPTLKAKAFHAQSALLPDSMLATIMNTMMKEVK